MSQPGYPSWPGLGDILPLLLFPTKFIFHLYGYQPDWKVWKLHGGDFENLIVNIYIESVKSAWGICPPCNTNFPHWGTELPGWKAPTGLRRRTAAYNRNLLVISITK